MPKHPARMQHSLFYYHFRAFVRAIFYTCCSVFLCLMMAGWNPIAYALAVF